MSRVVIKKRVNLDFLGEEYKEAYLEFKAVTVNDFSNYIAKLDEKISNAEAFEFISTTLKSHFISGKFPDDKGELFDVNKEEINDFDLETVEVVFKRLTGQDTDPK